ncbi:MAG: OsmC family protein, partial [Brevefilum sp.]
KMPVRKANAIWEGDLKSGKGIMSVESGLFTGAYSFGTRFENAEGTNPDELIGAALAGCFSMALSGDIVKAGYSVDEIRTEASVSVEKVDGGFQITKITLDTKARVPEISMDEFAELASGAKKNCPVSKALKAVDIHLQAHLLKQ